MLCQFKSVLEIRGSTPAQPVLASRYFLRLISGYWRKDRHLVMYPL